MNRIQHIKQYFSQYSWFTKVEKTTYKKEYLLFVSPYPYTQDSVIFNYEKQFKVRIKIQAIN